MLDMLYYVCKLRVMPNIILVVKFVIKFSTGREICIFSRQKCAINGASQVWLQNCVLCRLSMILKQHWTKDHAIHIKCLKREKFKKLLDLLWRQREPIHSYQMSVGPPRLL